MSTSKAGGSTRLGRDSISKRLGVKLFDSQKVKSGNIIVKQRGTKFHPGKNVRIGKDDTLYAVINGTVKFTKKKKYTFAGKLKKRRYVNVIAE